MQAVTLTRRTFGGALIGAATLPAAAVAEATHRVAIREFAFDPAVIEIAAGESVTWTNGDLAPHTATAAEGAWDTGALGRGEEATIRFATPGRYAYVCAFHPHMTGQVIVT